MHSCRMQGKLHETNPPDGVKFPGIKLTNSKVGPVVAPFITNDERI